MSPSNKSLKEKLNLKAKVLCSTTECQADLYTITASNLDVKRRRTLIPLMIAHAPNKCAFTSILKLTLMHKKQMLDVKR